MFKLFRNRSMGEKILEYTSEKKKQGKKFINLPIGIYLKTVAVLLHFILLQIMIGNLNF